MTTTPPTWSELHAMVPELRPKDYYTLPQVCGFAAVEWLMLRYNVEIYHWSLSNMGKPLISVALRPTIGEPMVLYGPTLDAALRAAVAAVAGEGK